MVLELPIPLAFWVNVWVSGRSLNSCWKSPFFFMVNHPFCCGFHPKFLLVVSIKWLLSITPRCFWYVHYLVVKSCWMLNNNWVLLSSCLPWNLATSCSSPIKQKKHSIFTMVTPQQFSFCELPKIEDGSLIDFHISQFYPFYPPKKSLDFLVKTPGFPALEWWPTRPPRRVAPWRWRGRRWSGRKKPREEARMRTVGEKPGDKKWWI